MATLWPHPWSSVDDPQTMPCVPVNRTWANVGWFSKWEMRLRGCTSNELSEKPRLVCAQTLLRFTGRELGRMPMPKSCAMLIIPGNITDRAACFVLYSLFLESLKLNYRFRAPPSAFWTSWTLKSRQLLPKTSWFRGSEESQKTFLICSISPMVPSPVIAASWEFSPHF